MRMELSITRSIVHSLATHSCNQFSTWRRSVARRRLRQARTLRLVLV